jgi:uncharacterized membrane protein YjgN (DUF898 family)
MALADATVARFEIGRVVKRTFDVIRDNFWSFALLSLLPGLASAVADRVGRRLGGDSTPSFPADDSVVVLVIAVVVYLLSWLVLQAVVVHAAMATLNGRRLAFADSVAAGFKPIVPMALISAVATIGVIGGLVLLVVPGIIVALMWFVALPVCIVEHPGVIGSLNRSRELTQGHRLQVLGVCILYFIVAVIGSIVVGVLIGAVIGFAMGVSGASPDAISGAASGILAQMLGKVIEAVMFLGIGSSLVAAVYCELRQIKEGVGPEALAAVFD